MYAYHTQSGRPWSKAKMQEAVECGPHQSATSNKATTHFKADVDKKVRLGQAKLVAWDAIKDDPPVELKISPIAVIPH